MLQLALAAALAAPSPDPYDVFARARAYWLTQTYPTRLEYDVAVAVTEGGNSRVERYADDFDAVNDVLTVDPVSDYERAHPTVPSGINVGLLGLRLGKPLPPADWLGIPRLAPNYSFGMAPFVPAPAPTPFNSSALVDEIRKEFHDPNPRITPSPTPAPGLSEIVTVVAHNRDYTITMLGTETIDGHSCYHLSLLPQREPHKFRIRQAWIDESTFATWRLVDAGNFAAGAVTTVPWTIRFADVAGAHYISEEDAGAALAKDGEVFSNVAFRFENVHSVTESSLEGILGEHGAMVEEPPP
jgi:hypothetical protein